MHSVVIAGSVLTLIVWWDYGWDVVGYAVEDVTLRLKY